MNIVLASQSQIRQKMLSDAGIVCTTQPANLDEHMIATDALEAGTSGEELAAKLARAKCEAIAEVTTAEFVIGADQVLIIDEAIVSKVASKAEALDRLAKMAGRSHHLVSAVHVVDAARNSWSYTDVAAIHMHALTRAWLEAYLDQHFETVRYSVTCYQVESVGVQMIERIDGDFFTVLGMPLLPLIGHLQRCGAVR